MTAPPQRLGAEKEEKHINVQMGPYYGSSRYAMQFKNVYYKQIYITYNYIQL